ncbi:hypothetical protein WJX84_003079 [Apatococcus fuscideae]|uniref:Uncharacterized protein n=1 Tax=Apatococcus fuscideae TaxID=2026836 RepID=A0AAW1TCZ8_9CHLO
MDMNPRADVAAAQPKAALPDYADRLDLESDVDVKQFEQSGPCGAHYSQAGIEAAEEEQTRGSKVQASSAKGQKEPLQSSHPTSMQPQSIDDDAMPALQSPAAYSPSAPQPLHQQDSQAVSDLPISIPRPTGSASPTPPRQAEQDRSSASMLPTPESTEKSLFNRLEDQYISIQRFPTGSESPDRLQSRGRNAASQTQAPIADSTASWMKRSISPCKSTTSHVPRSLPIDKRAKLTPEALDMLRTHDEMRDKAYLEWLARKNYEARMAKAQDAARRARRAAEIREELKSHDAEVLEASMARWPISVPVSIQGDQQRSQSRW